MKHYTRWQRAVYWIADRIGVQVYRLRDDNTVRPSLYYSGWRLCAQRAISRLLGHA